MLSPTCHMLFTMLSPTCHMLFTMLSPTSDVTEAADERTLETALWETSRIPDTIPRDIPYTEHSESMMTIW